jgi:hypothetical protein
VGTQFSDPAWWPQPPPKPPQRISPAKIVFGTLLPLAAVVAVIVLIVKQESHHAPRPTAPPSIAAFEACLRSHGVTGGKRGSTVGQAAGACKSELPAGTQPQAFAPAQSAAQARVQQSFEECIRRAVAASPGGGGGFGNRGSDRQAFDDAVAVCRATAENEATSPPGPSTTTTTGPAVA